MPPGVIGGKAAALTASRQYAFVGTTLSPCSRRFSLSHHSEASATHVGADLRVGIKVNIEVDEASEIVFPLSQRGKYSCEVAIVTVGQTMPFFDIESVFGAYTSLFLIVIHLIVVARATLRLERPRRLFQESAYPNALLDL
jgi:hypothetical protein